MVIGVAKAASVLSLTFGLLDEFAMFEKSLTDLIRGIRANKKNEQKYVSACLQEIRNEVKSNDIDVKANAIAKLTYVSYLGVHYRRALYVLIILL
jgi:hypothetical protein